MLEVNPGETWLEYAKRATAEDSQYESFGKAWQEAFFQAQYFFLTDTEEQVEITKAAIANAKRGIAKVDANTNPIDAARASVMVAKGYMNRSSAMRLQHVMSNISSDSVQWLLYGGTANKRLTDTFAPKPQGSEKRIAVEVNKVDEELGLVLGFAIVCNIDGEPYFDLQGDHIPEDSMLKAATDFMQHSRVALEMHQGDEAGSVVFAWPLTDDIAKAMGIETKQTGLMIAMKPGSDEMLSKFKSGEYTGFSIGGFRQQDEEVADA